MRTLLSVALLASLGIDQNMPAAKPVTVSAAVSLTNALTEIAEAYAKQKRGTVRFNFGASNVLARQIVNGAPVDLFISADEAQMDVVAEAKLVAGGTRVDLLRNQLAVVVPSDRPKTFGGIRDLASPAFRRIAIGDPAAVPAGVYAKQYLEKEGVWASVETRIVPSGSVRAVLAAVESGAADAGIVYRTDARIALRATVAFVVPADSGPRIVYPAAVIATAAAPGEARHFLGFLRGETAKPIFLRFGFTFP